ncbi:MAG: HDIG domain-containing protein [Bacilli bacterium]|nr:HDIG domain-containing protein [Bacilli bacterium]
MKQFRKYIPNLLTVSRIILTPLIVYLGLTNHIKILIVVAMLVALTDYFDGLFARKWQITSELGAKLDAISDKVLAIGLLIILIYKNHAFFYVLILECLIAFLNLYFYFRRGVVNSLLIGKIKTWIIFSTIVIGLFDLIFTHWNIPINYFVYFTVFMQICSLLSYISSYIDSKTKKKRLIDDYIEFFEIVKPILEHPEFKKRKEYIHHIGESVYEHTLRVSFDSYKIAKKLHWDYKAAAIGGILHDFYDSPWQESKEKKPFFKKHGFVHAEEARINAWKYFPSEMNFKIEDIIRRHMFPLNKRPPKYKESWLISFVDKADSMDFIMHPKALLKLFFHKEIQEEKKLTKKGFIKTLKKKLQRK